MSICNYVFVWSSYTVHIDTILIWGNVLSPNNYSYISVQNLVFIAIQSFTQSSISSLVFPAHILKA